MKKMFCFFYLQEEMVKINLGTAEKNVLKKFHKEN